MCLFDSLQITCGVFDSRTLKRVDGYGMGKFCSGIFSKRPLESLMLSVDASKWRTAQRDRLNCLLNNVGKGGVDKSTASFYSTYFISFKLFFP